MSSIRRWWSDLWVLQGNSPCHAKLNSTSLEHTPPGVLTHYHRTTVSITTGEEKVCLRKPFFKTQELSHWNKAWRILESTCWWTLWIVFYSKPIEKRTKVTKKSSFLVRERLIIPLKSQTYQKELVSLDWQQLIANSFLLRYSELSKALLENICIGMCHNK